MTRLALFRVIVGWLATTSAHAQFAGPFPIPSQDADASLTGYSGYMQCRATERGMNLNVNALDWDAHRTLWLGLEDGLLRCDGDRQTLYQHSRKDSTSLPNNSVTDVRVATDGRIWVGTQSGMAVLDPSTGRFKRFRITGDSLNPVQANRFWQVAPMPDNGAITITESGVYRMHADGAFEKLVHPTSEGDALAAPKVRQFILTQDPVTNAVFVPSSQGLFRIAPDGTIADIGDLASPAGLETGEPLAVALADADHLLWFDLRTWTIKRMNLRTGTWSMKDAGSLLPRDEGARALWMGRHGEVWLSSWSNRLRVQSADAAEALEVYPGGRSAMAPPTLFVVRAMRHDDEGRLWLASSHGIIALLPSDPRVQRIAVPGLEQGQWVMNLYNDRTGTLLVGTYRAGLKSRSTVNGEWTTFYQAHPKRGDRFKNQENTITDILPIGNGRYFLATYHGILELDSSLRQLTHRDDLAALHPTLARGILSDLARGEDGTIWAATWEKGLIRFNAETGMVRQYTHEPSNPRSLPINRLLCLLVDRRGDLWIGANDGGGLSRYNKDTDDFDRFALSSIDDQGEALGVVRAMAEDEDGAIWIGTHKGGVARFDPKTNTTEVFDQTAGVPGDLIRAVASHPTIGTWVGGKNGLARWNNEQHVFQPFDLSVQWSDGVIRMVPSPEEQVLWLISEKELIRLDLRQKAPASREVSPRLLELRMNGASVSVQPPLRLVRGRDRISIEFALDDPIRAQGTRVAWRLVGQSDEWTDCIGCRSAAFADLPAGDYRFEARTLLDHGAWSAPVVLASFEVRPPWWATWWFRIAILLSIASVAYAGFKAYVKQQLRLQRERYEREQAVMQERMRIASDMHDDLGAGLSALKLRSEMALRVEKDPGKREQLSSLAATAGELIGSMRQMIWAMDQEQTSLQDLLVYATNYARNYCAQHGLTLKVDIAPGLPAAQLTTEQRRNLFLIVKEALHNSIKHAQATEATISAGWSDGLHLTIADNGIGLPTGADLGTGNGMRNMRRRAQELGGTLEIRGGAGTTLSVFVPLETTPNLRSIVGG